MYHMHDLLVIEIAPDLVSIGHSKNGHISIAKFPNRRYYTNLSIHGQRLDATILDVVPFPALARWRLCRHDIPSPRFRIGCFPREHRGSSYNSYEFH